MSERSGPYGMAGRCPERHREDGPGGRGRSAGRWEDTVGRRKCSAGRRGEPASRQDGEAC